jgi:hypothetical protein
VTGTAEQPQGDWRYEVLAQDKVIEADAITSPTYNKLLEFSSIGVGGFRTARFFVEIRQADLDGDQGKFTKDAKLRVSVFHNTKGGSHDYREAEIPMDVTTYLSGLVEIPVIGPDLRIIVWGDNLPKVQMTAESTLYLLK